MKITKKSMKEFIKYKLSNDKHWTEKALFKIFEMQTSEEQTLNNVMVSNGVGFSSYDSFILTQFIKTIKEKRKKISTYKLSNKQWVVLFNKMPKYWEQILNISDKDKLNKCYIKHLINSGLQMNMNI